jgi:hypothetical protein
MQTAPTAADLGSVEALDEQISSFAGLASRDARRRDFHASSQGHAESLVLNAAPKAWRVGFENVRGRRAVHRNAYAACLIDGYS